MTAEIAEVLLRIKKIRLKVLGKFPHGSTLRDEEVLLKEEIKELKKIIKER